MTAQLGSADVFVGFARTYYFKDLVDAPLLTTLVHLHGILFTLWILLFITRTSLIANRPTHTGVLHGGDRLPFLGGEPNFTASQDPNGRTKLT